MRTSNLKFHFDSHNCLFIEDQNTHSVFFLTEDSVKELIKILKGRIVESSN